MTHLSGKYVLLTGGSRGIGPVIAAGLAQRGAHLALAARSQAGLDQVARSLEPYGVRTLTVAVDLAQPAERRRLAAAVLQHFPAVDILVNNAGLESEGAYLDLSWETIEQTLAVNLAAPLELAGLLLPGMLARRSGHIVNIASIAGKCGAPYAALYSATKAGLAEWAQGLRLELAGSGVQVSTIFPGYTTGVGMFARFGLAPPWAVGSCTPAQVADAVVKAIERDAPEAVVNSTPQRLFYALKALSPALGDWIMVKSGVVAFQRRKVGL